MGSPTCQEVRSYLASLSGKGPAVRPSPDTWSTLASHGAVAGTPEAPSLTPVGQHVLAELEVRAYRTDALSLDRVAEDLTRLLTEIDGLAKTAEYFLADLGPVVPPAAVSLVRPLAVCLANRRETPEELAEQFRQVWGGVEVMGGDPRDRLLAAELLHATGANMEQLYSPIMNTTERIREKIGSERPSLAPAAMLQVAAGAETPAPLEGFLAIRAPAGSEEAAAMLAAAGDAAAMLARRDDFARRLSAGASPNRDAMNAATLLVADHVPEAVLPRTVALSARLGSTVVSPLTSAALLAGHGTLTPEELVDWHAKARGMLRNHGLAPTDRELGALGTALLYGLPERELIAPAPVENRAAAPPASLPALTAIYSWLYRPLVETSGPVAQAAGAP